MLMKDGFWIVIDSDNFNHRVELYKGEWFGFDNIKNSAIIAHAISESPDNGEWNKYSWTREQETK